MTKDSSGSRRFDVALSFPGEHRDFVKQVAGHLADAFGKKRVLYDKYYEAEFARPNLDVYLPELYRAQSELIVLFLCPEYAAKRWCNLEWRHIRDLLASVDEDRIMFLRYGYDGDFEKLGILRGDGTVNFEGRPANEIAELILQRFHINHGTTPPKPPAPAPAVPTDISRIIKYAPAQLIGREAETKLLNDAWAKAQNNETKRPHVLTFVALGGEGKTSLVAKWAADLAYQNWPGCDAVFAWSFYSQGTREQVAASSDLFLKEALTFFGDPDMAGSAQGAFGKGRRLVQLVGEKRALLILDGLEPLQYAPTSPTPGELKDAGLAALLKGLATNNHGLCVVTTRYSIPDLRAYWQTTAPEVNLLRLSKEAGVALLRSLKVKGAQAEFETLVEEVKGHALTLNLLGTYLRDAHAGDIRKRDQVKLEEADEEQGGHAFRVMDAYVRSFESEGEKGQRALAVLRLMGLFDRPADAGCLKALWKAPAIEGLTEPLVAMSEAHRNVAFSRLEDAKLLTVNRDTAGVLLALDAHPLLREFFSRQLREQRPEAWRASTGGFSSISTRQRRTSPSPHLKICNPSTRPFPTVARRGCSRKRVARFTATASSVEVSSTARRNSAGSVPTWEPSPASSRNRGAASRPRSPKPPKPGC
jgi:TIR domain